MVGKFHLVTIQGCLILSGTQMKTQLLMERETSRSFVVLLTLQKRRLLKSHQNGVIKGAGVVAQW